MKLLELDKVNAGYDHQQILFDVSMEIEEKSICALIGPNGSGKSTLLKTIAGLTKIYSGSVKLKGEDITGEKPHEITRSGVVYIPQLQNLYTSLTVRENFILAGYTVPKHELESRIKDVLEILPIKDWMERKVMTLSGGERQIVAMGAALLRKPSIMLLDEPASHLSPKFARFVEEKIKELKDDGITILIVEQLVGRVLEIADDAYILVAGRIRHYENAKKLLRSPDLDKMFLGLK